MTYNGQPLINEEYLNQFRGNWYDQKTLITHAITDTNSSEYDTYDWLRKKVYYSTYASNLQSTFDYSMYIYSAYRVIYGKSVPSTSGNTRPMLRKYMEFYEYVVTHGEFEGVPTIYTETPIVTYLGSEVYTPPHNDSNDYKQIDFSYYMDKPLNSNGNTYYTKYSQDANTTPKYSIEGIIGKYMNNSGSQYDPEDYPKIIELFNDYNQDINKTHDCLAKVYAVFRFNGNEYYSEKEYFDKFYNFLVEIMTTGQLPESTSGEEISGDIDDGSSTGNVTTEDKWPKQLRKSAVDSKFNIVYFLSGTKMTTNMNGLESDPTGSYSSLYQRMNVFTGQDRGNVLGANNNAGSLDSLFLDMVNNEIDYPNNKFVTE